VSVLRGNARRTSRDAKDAGRQENGSSTGLPTMNGPKSTPVQRVVMPAAKNALNGR
jgi:hypothetical protein